MRTWGSGSDEGQMRVIKVRHFFLINKFVQQVTRFGHNLNNSFYTPIKVTSFFEKTCTLKTNYIAFLLRLLKVF